MANGADKEEMDYTQEPTTDFQRAIRKNSAKLRDHICKEMNELNLRRCTLVVSGWKGRGRGKRGEGRGKEREAGKDSTDRKHRAVLPRSPGKSLV